MLTDVSNVKDLASSSGEIAEWIASFSYPVFRQI